MNSLTNIIKSQHSLHLLSSRNHTDWRSEKAVAGRAGEDAQGLSLRGPGCAQDAEGAVPREGTEAGAGPRRVRPLKWRLQGKVKFSHKPWVLCGWSHSRTEDEIVEKWRPLTLLWRWILSPFASSARILQAMRDDGSQQIAQGNTHPHLRYKSPRSGIGFCRVAFCLCKFLCQNKERRPEASDPLDPESESCKLPNMGAHYWTSVLEEQQALFAAQIWVFQRWHLPLERNWGLQLSSLPPLCSPVTHLDRPELKVQLGWAQNCYVIEPPLFP